LKESKIIVRLQVLGGMRRQMTHARLFLASSRRRRSRAALAPDSFQLPAPLRQPNPTRILQFLRCRQQQNFIFRGNVYCIRVPSKNRLTFDQEKYQIVALLAKFHETRGTN
jgi:hypothetical protein